MKPKEQRIAIAEACGWLVNDDGVNGISPINVEQGLTNPKICSWKLPDYLRDLNAMHEAEKTLRKPMKGSDTDTIIGDRMHKYAELIGYAFDATAAQRAEAFLKTIGKWEGDNQ